MIGLSRYIVVLLGVLACVVIVLSLGRAGEVMPATSVALDEAPPPVVMTEEDRAFEQELEEIGAALDGQVGIAVVDVDTNKTYEFNGDDLLPQQSVSKLWVSMAALALVDEDAFDLNERVVIGPDDLTLFHQPIREIVKARGAFVTDYAELMDRALTRSDNTANDTILRRVGGPGKVQAWMDENRIKGVRFGTDERTKQSAIAGLQWRQYYSTGRGFYDARDAVPDAQRRAAFEAYHADPIDGATASGMAQALARLARGRLLSPNSTAYLREVLSNTRSGPRRLKGGVPAGWSIDHKTGTGQFLDGEQSGYNDVGILTAPDGHEYAIATMIGRTRASYAARMEMMQAVVRATVAFHDAGEDSKEGEDERPAA